MSALYRFRAVVVVATLAAAVGFYLRPVGAADHREAPRARADHAADLADLYAWHDSVRDTLTIVMTYGGDPTLLPVFDFDVLYAIHIDNTGDYLPEFDIDVRFGVNNVGDIGVQVLNLPGAGGPIVGEVEHILRGANGTLAFAGVRDDPFFFDGTGFRDTLMTGTLSFDNTRNTFANANIMAIVLEMPLSAAQAGGSNLHVWGTTARR